MKLLFKPQIYQLLKMSQSSFHWLTQSLIPLLTDWLSHSSTRGVLINLKILPVLDVQYMFLYCAMICLPIRNGGVQRSQNENYFKWKRSFCWEMTHISFMETCQIEIKFGFWKKSCLFVFLFLVSDLRDVWWQKDS